MCRSIISLSKIAHQMWCNQMWCNHPFCQINKTIERAVGVVVGGDRKGREKGGGEGGQNLKKGGRQYGRVYIKLGGLGPFCQLDHRYYESGIISSSNIIL